MSSIDTQQNDYKALTKIYMDYFNSEKFAKFLNTTQTGYAHSSSGIDFPRFMRTLFTSICFCTIQLTLFCSLRSIFNFLYQPRCFCVPVNERMEVLPRGFFKWIVPTLKTSINTYLSLGLDAYFFIRFISVLLLFFSFIGTLNMIILIPINFTGSDSSFEASGLDKLSLSNIASSNVYRLNAHFVMGVITIGLFHWLLIYEFQSFVTIKQSYVLSKSHKNSVLARTIMLFNVPPHIQDKDILYELLDIIPGGIRNIWEVYEFDKIEHEVEKSKDALEFIELSQLWTLKKYYKSKSKWWGHSELQEFLKKHDIKFYPPIYCHLIKIPQIDRTIKFRLPGWIRFFLFQQRVSMLEWSLTMLFNCQMEIENQKLKLNNSELTKHNKLFIEFETQQGACIAHQCLLSQSQGFLDKTIMEVHPHDVVWNNVSRTDGIACKFERYLVTLLFICIIILYVIPVSLIGLVSQIPQSSQTLPFIRWINWFPDEAKETILGFIPSILLTILTQLVMILFRFFTYFKGKATGSEIEIDLQKWYFVFLFVQQFLVVTISSSITVIFKQIIDQPTSIPILLATNLPKSATFFFQYICLRAFAFCGDNFLRIKKLILTNSYYKMKDLTPRQKFKRITTLPQIKWGTTFAVYSIYATIGISYSIISPLISVFIIFFLNLSILYYKYALKYIYSHVNTSETMGKLYPTALLHLYTGIYCLECCLIGVFFLSKNSKGSHSLRVQGWIMTWILFFTIFANILIYNRYMPYFSNLPILNDKINQDDKSSDESTETNATSKYDHEILYLHPAFKYESPTIWLPRDPDNVVDVLMQNIKEKNTIITTQTNGAQALVGKFFNNLKIIVSEAPPDYK